MLMKIRYGYGQQTHLEKLEILHSWYSDLRAYLPMICKHVEDYTDKKHWNNLTYAEMMTDISNRIKQAREQYDRSLEALEGCSTPKEKDYMATLSGLKEVLDEITAISKVIDKTIANDDDGVSMG